MLQAIRIENIPQGPQYTRYREWLLRNIQIATAGNWNVDNENHVILILLFTDPSHLLDHCNRVLTTMCALANLDAVPLTFSLI
jgi:hypothetical protein